MPAAAVIPAPVAYIKVVAVKKLVVDFKQSPFFESLTFNFVLCSFSMCYSEKIRAFKANTRYEYISMG